MTLDDAIARLVEQSANATIAALTDQTFRVRMSYSDISVADPERDYVMAYEILSPIGTPAGSIERVRRGDELVCEQLWTIKPGNQSQ